MLYILVALHQLYAMQSYSCGKSERLGRLATAPRCVDGRYTTSQCRTMHVMLLGLPQPQHVSTGGHAPQATGVS